MKKNNRLKEWKIKAELQTPSMMIFLFKHGQEILDYEENQVSKEEGQRDSSFWV